MLYSPLSRRESREVIFSFADERPHRSRMLDRIIKTYCRPPANANPQALRAEINLKLDLARASKDAMNAILPNGLLFFTFCPCHIPLLLNGAQQKVKRENYSASLASRAQPRGAGCELGRWKFISHKQAKLHKLSRKSKMSLTKKRNLSLIEIKDGYPDTISFWIEAYFRFEVTTSKS